MGGISSNDAGDSNANSPTSAFTEAFFQGAMPAQTATNLPGTLATVTLIASAVGLVDVSWDTTTPDPS